MPRIYYVELPASDVEATRLFYENAFSWLFTDFGPSYSATTGGDVDLGLQGDAAEGPSAPLPVIEVDNLESALRAVIAAGGQITRSIFAFPGGRRFQFADPSGNELAVSHSETA